MPGKGVEPLCPCGRGILSPDCMPISTPRLSVLYFPEIFCRQLALRRLLRNLLAQSASIRANNLRRPPSADSVSYALIEATSGIEPLNSCFADSCLTSWLRRRLVYERAFFTSFTMVSTSSKQPIPTAPQASWPFLGPINAYPNDLSLFIFS